MTLAFAFQGIGRATVPLAITAIRITLVVAGALLLSSALGYGVGALFALIVTGNCLSVALLSVAFVVSVRAYGRTAVRPYATIDSAAR